MVCGSEGVVLVVSGFPERWRLYFWWSDEISLVLMTLSNSLKMDLGVVASIVLRMRSRFR